MTDLRSSGSRLLASLVESTTSQNKTVICRRSEARFLNRRLSFRMVLTLVFNSGYQRMRAAVVSCEQFGPGSDRDADLAQHRLGEERQRLEVDLVLLERLRIAVETELFEAVPATPGKTASYCKRCDPLANPATLKPIIRNAMHSRAALV